MPFDPQTIRSGERIYLTQDAWDALSLIKVRSEERDKFIEDAIWEALEKFPGIIDCINARKEAVRQFKQRQGATIVVQGKDVPVKGIVDKMRDDHEGK